MNMFSAKHSFSFLPSFLSTIWIEPKIFSLIDNFTDLGVALTVLKKPNTNRFTQELSLVTDWITRRKVPGAQELSIPIIAVNIIGHDIGRPRVLVLLN
jgi:hypothetical protein